MVLQRDMSVESMWFGIDNVHIKDQRFPLSLDVTYEFHVVYSREDQTSFCLVVSTTVLTLG